MITKRDVEALDREKWLWDEGKGAVAGYFARRQKSPAVSLGVFYRTAGARQRFQIIGRFGAPWTVEDGRKEARRILGLVAVGADPAAEKAASRKAETVADLADAYIEAAEAGLILFRGKPKSASTVATDKGRVARHIKPLLGHLKVAAVTPADVVGFRNSVTKGETAGKFKTGPRGLARVTGGAGTATRTMALLSAIFSYAINVGIRADNPCRGVDVQAYAKRERRMTSEEYAALGRALDSLPDFYRPALAIFRFLALTGWRLGEGLNLRWSELDLDNRTARLGKTKTGQSIRPLSAAALEILAAQPRSGPYVFPSISDVEKPIGGAGKMWRKIRDHACLPVEVTPHVFRHSFASEAGDLDFSDLTIGMLLGHRKATVTSKYVHKADKVILAAADEVAGMIVAKMAGSTA